MRGLARTLLETMVNEIRDARADMACGDGATARNGYRERAWRPRWRHRPAHTQALPERRVHAAPSGRYVRRAGRGLVEQAPHLARVHAEVGRARGARAHRKRGVAQEGPHDRRDHDGAHRRRKEGRVLL